MSGIIVIVRARDEAHRIAQFAESYRSADRILVADGGSLDNTKEIAASFPNVEVRDYLGRVQLEKGYWRNPDSDHINWLIQWAKEYDPDFCILDDADCRMNYLLRQDYRSILDRTDADLVMVTRLYLWGLDKHFPELAKPGVGHTQWEPSLWAWRGNLDLTTIDIPPAYELSINGTRITDPRAQSKVLDLMPPYALLHFSWDDPVRTREKVKFYRESGFIPNMSENFPLDSCGPVEPLPEWAKE